MTYEGVGMSRNGSTWSSPQIFGVGAMTGVSCASATSCLAVGTFVPTDGSLLDRAVIARWSGSSWASLPHSAVGVASSLNAVSCARAGGVPQLAP